MVVSDLHWCGIISRSPLGPLMYLWVVYQSFCVMMCMYVCVIWCCCVINEYCPVVYS